MIVKKKINSIVSPQYRRIRSRAYASDGSPAPCTAPKSPPKNCRAASSHSYRAENVREPFTTDMLALIDFMLEPDPTVRPTAAQVLARVCQMMGKDLPPTVPVCFCLSFIFNPSLSLHHLQSLQLSSLNTSKCSQKQRNRLQKHDKFSSPSDLSFYPLSSRSAHFQRSLHLPI